MQLFNNSYLQTYLDDLPKVIFNYGKVLIHDSHNNIIVVKLLLVASDGSVLIRTTIIIFRIQIFNS